MSRDKRMKASDVFRRSSPVYGEKVSFEEALPEIESLTVEVEEIGRGVGSISTKRVYTKPVGEYIDCSNSLCYNDGFSIGKILRKMVRVGETDLETTELCQGYEGSPKGKRKYGACMNSFGVKVHIDYRVPASDAGS